MSTFFFHGRERRKNQLPDASKLSTRYGSSFVWIAFLCTVRRWNKKVVFYFWALRIISSLFRSLESDALIDFFAGMVLRHACMIAFFYFVEEETWIPPAILRLRTKAFANLLKRKSRFCMSCFHGRTSEINTANITGIFAVAFKSNSSSQIIAHACAGEKKMISFFAHLNPKKILTLARLWELWAIRTTVNAESIMS